MGKPAYQPHSLICDFLRELGVPFTRDYAMKRFAAMPFHTIFGLVKLLKEYGVESEGYSLQDKSEILKIDTPFLAHTPGGFVIVTGTGPGRVDYLTQGVAESMPTDEFEQVFDGTVIVSCPSADASEPDYNAHVRLEFLMKAKKWVLGFCAAVLFLYLFIAHGIYSHLSTVLIAAIDIGGLYFTYLLVQKSMKIYNPAADRVCGVLQAGGCDSILATDASKFFGLFGWSEVGFAYFSVSLGTLLLFPAMLPWLALCNLCCLPFTVWSIWYQRFRAHKWCTLCVCVQGSLWLLFFSYLFGGWLAQAWPVSPLFIILGIAYLGVMLAINALMQLIEKPDDESIK